MSGLRTLEVLSRSVRQTGQRADPVERSCFIHYGPFHILKVMPDKKLGLLHMNPGAAGVHGFHKVKTLIRFGIIEGKIVNAEVIELGSRTKLKS